MQFAECGVETPESSHSQGVQEVSSHNSRHAAHSISALIRWAWCLLYAHWGKHRPVCWLFMLLVDPLFDKDMDGDSI